MYVIGTAGHVDHGKSALVRALTGIDPDRLQEEKARGMTIDLGFAWLTLPGGRDVSIVDVPGHERFVKNMLAGAGGIDLALLVIAADEGVMPQTREHLAILDLLGVPDGLLVLTKADLVEPAWLELVAADVRAAVDGTVLADAPLVTCSAVTGAGLPELLAVIEQRLDSAAPRRDLGRPRLPIDRAFTIPGFGTVVTGTLIDGSLAVGQEVEVVPGGARSRIRGLQTHRQKEERAEPGTRVAANVPSFEKDALYRGQVLTTPGWLRPTTAVDVQLRALASLGRPIRHNLPVSFHSGAAEVPGRIRLLDRDALAPGEDAPAQIRLQAPVAVVRGDRFVVRTSDETIGGGEILDPHARRHRRHHAPTLGALAGLRAAAPDEALLAIIVARGPLTMRDLAAASELPADRLAAAVRDLAAAGRLVLLAHGRHGPDSLLLSTAAFDSLSSRAREALEAFHRQHPLRPGMPREELRTRLGLGVDLFEPALARWQQAGIVEEQAGRLTLAGRRAQLTPAQQAEADAYVAALRAQPFAPPTDRRLPPDLLAFLEERGDVVPAGDGVVFAREAYEEMVRRIIARLRERGTVTLAEARDMLGTSRRYVQALLEHLDRERVTRRTGDARVLGPKAPPA